MAEVLPNDHKDIMAQTYVVGGFGREGNGEPELEWVSSKIKSFNVDPESVYFKGDELKDLLFAKFENEAEACKTMDAIEKSKPEIGGKEIWCKPESPVEVRAVRGLLLGLRWQLGEWGFNKKAIKGRRTILYDDCWRKGCRERSDRGKHDEHLMA